MTAFEWYKRRLDTPRDAGGTKHLKFKIKLRIFENDQILMKTFKFQAEPLSEINFSLALARKIKEMMQSILP